MILVDFSHLFYRNLFMNLDNILQNQNFLYHVVLQNILYFSKKYNASKENRLILCCDKGSWRKQYFKENKDRFPEYSEKDIKRYKGTRKKEDIAISWDEIFNMIDELLDVLEKYSNFLVMRVENAEADDVIAVLVKNIKNEGQIVISSDKDFVQLFRYNKDLIIYDPIKRIEKTIENVPNPDFFLKKHIIMGDRIDGILPIKKRCGEKTAEKMVKDIDKLIQIDPELRERYRFNEVLISFDKIPEVIEKEILNTYERIKNVFNYNQFELTSWFISKGLKRMVENVEMFSLRNQIEKLDMKFDWKRLVS